MKKDFIVRRSITMVEGKPHVETYSEQDLVRCKDCKYAEVLKWLDDAIVCKKHNYTGVRPEEFFCADGERR